MRLTNVTRMALPPGRLMSYGLTATVTATGEQLPISFDQRRHVGQGQRPASWMAVAARLPRWVRPDDLSAAWWAVVARHGTLATAFGAADDGTLGLHRVALEPGCWNELPVPSGQDPRQVLRALFDQACAPFQQPSHRLVLLTPHPGHPDRRPMVILGADHAHVDMWSFLVLLRDLVTCLDDRRAGRPLGAGLEAVAEFAEHTAALEARPPAPVEVQRRWAALLAAGGGAMPTFPLPLGSRDFCGESLIEVRDVLDAASAVAFASRAAELGVRTIGLAMSVLTRATRELAGAPLRALFPVHSRDEPRWRDSVGWFITNSVLECTDPDPAACTAAVREAIRLGSYPLAPIFAPYGGMPTRPGLFALSWLDTRRLPPVPDDADVQYVSAGVHDDGVMIWFIVNDAGLHLRARYPNTPEAMRQVPRWLDAVELGLRAIVN
ncbi:peptide synthetase [Micropruina sp.]|uniref:peptide synthetase n=1 Tax=Micropruina sp. TaxID=2737536 RepID=UPI0039E64685